MNLFHIEITVKEFSSRCYFLLLKLFRSPKNANTFVVSRIWSVARRLLTLALKGGEFLD